MICVDVVRQHGRVDTVFPQGRINIVLVIFHYPCLGNIDVQALIVDIITNRCLGDEFRQVEAIPEFVISCKQHGISSIDIGLIDMKLQ